MLGKLEKIHRLFLDSIRESAVKLVDAQDLNPGNILLLYNVGKDRVTASDIINRGHYLGTNVSYNVKKLCEHGYLVQEKAMHDGRQTILYATEKGIKVQESVQKLIASQIQHMEKDLGMDLEQFQSANKTLQNIEVFFGDLKRNGVQNEITEAA